MAYVIDRMFYINNVLGCIYIYNSDRMLYIYIYQNYICHFDDLLLFLYQPDILEYIFQWDIGIYMYIYIIYMYIYIYVCICIYIGILMKKVFIYPNIPLMGGSINGDTQNSWCVMEISNRKWMMARGTPILGNLHSDIMFHISH